MTTLILIIHVIVSLALIFIVLLQTGKGAEMGAAFGGSNQTVFGSQGAATFLSKVTTGAAVLFMVTSLSLAVLSSRRAGSVMSDAPPPAPAVEPAALPLEAAPPPVDVPAIPLEPASPAGEGAAVPAPAAEEAAVPAEESEEAVPPAEPAPASQ
jgi:preprotein translocase subunit SecG